MSVTIDGTSRDWYELAAGDWLLMRVSSFPMFVVFPVIHDLSAIVYNSNGDQT
jgi:hypothetical protein